MSFTGEATRCSSGILVIISCPLQGKQPDILVTYLSLFHVFYRGSNQIFFSILVIISCPLQGKQPDVLVAYLSLFHVLYRGSNQIFYWHTCHYFMSFTGEATRYSCGILVIISCPLQGKQPDILVAYLSLFHVLYRGSNQIFLWHTCHYFMSFTGEATRYSCGILVMISCPLQGKQPDVLVAYLSLFHVLYRGSNQIFYWHTCHYFMSFTGEATRYSCGILVIISCPLQGKQPDILVAYLSLFHVLYRGSNQIFLWHTCHYFMSFTGEATRYSCGILVIISCLLQGKQPDILVAYLTYIKEQWEVDPHSVDMAKLRLNAPLRTNKGFQNPSKVSIHLTPLYLSKWDLQKDYPGEYGDWDLFLL